MDSRRFVVSPAASCLLSWRLAVFILRGGGLVYLSSLWRLPLGLCRAGVSHVSVGDLCVLGASRRPQREQTCGLPLCLSPLALAQEALQQKLVPLCAR